MTQGIGGRGTRKDCGLRNLRGRGRCRFIGLPLVLPYICMYDSDMAKKATKQASKQRSKPGRKPETVVKIETRVRPETAKQIDAIAHDMGISRARLMRVTLETMCSMDAAGQQGVFSGLEQLIEEALAKAISRIERAG